MSDTRKPMTQEELAEIRELAEAATPGPWYGCFEPKENMIEARGAKWVMGLSPVSCPFTESLIETCGEDVISSFECPKQVLISTDDLEYMVAANPKTVLALLDEVKRLREEVARLDKEADWLVKVLSLFTEECPYRFYLNYEERIPLPPVDGCEWQWPECHECDIAQKYPGKCWRETARKAVEEEERYG